MGIFNMIVGTVIFIIAAIVIMQPVILILDATAPIMNTASGTTMYGTDASGQRVAVGSSNAGGDLTTMLLYAVGLFMVIGFIVWLVMRAPSIPDSYGLQDDTDTGRFQ